MANEKQDGEDDYIAKWSAFNYRFEPYSYRLFSHFMPPSPDIVPENLGRCFIEPILNPEPLRNYYSDKTMFPVICGKKNVPKTLLCRINGGSLLNGDFFSINSTLNDILTGEDRLILKPSVDSNSGEGVILFTKRGSEWVSSSDGAILSFEYLIKYGDNFVLQRAVKQHKDLEVFNPSSVNTLRLAVYRSVRDEEPHVLASIMRVGRCGEYVDNAHRGGVFVGVDLKSGKVGNRLFNQYGQSKTQWNGMDYSKIRYIPYWEEVKQFACDISRKIYHHRLIALDITISSEGRPQLIEYNLNAFSYWLFMFTGQKPFGDYTDEIIEFCKKNGKIQ